MQLFYTGANLAGVGIPLSSDSCTPGLWVTKESVCTALHWSRTNTHGIHIGTVWVAYEVKFNFISSVIYKRPIGA